MTRAFILAICALTLAACDKKVERIESVETLIVNPERLKELRAACKADHDKVGDAQCNAVAEATRRRFLDGGASPYAADPVKKPVPPTATSQVPSASSASKD